MTIDFFELSLKLQATGHLAPFTLLRLTFVELITGQREREEVSHTSTALQRAIDL